jgi:tetratricopeptide (TPR) repeat protein
MGYGHSIVFVLFLVLLVRQRRTGPFGWDRAVLLVWIAGFVTYLALMAGLRAPRHLLPVLPVILVFVGEAYHRAWGWIRGRIVGPQVAFVGLALVFVGLSWGRLSDAAGLFRERRWRDPDRAEVVAGRWLAQNFAAETSILFDAYAYVPGKFVRIHRTFGQSYPMVNHLRPDLLIVRSAMARRYADLEDGARARIGETAYRDRHFFYRYLQEGRIPAYRLLKDFGGVAVYQRMETGEGEPVWAQDWLERVRLLGAGRLMGQGTARETVGDIHASLGRFDDAIAEYALGLQAAPDGARIRYKLACAYLGSGRLREAKESFGAAAEQIASVPAGHRAEVRHNMARQYFERGYYADALAEVSRALELDPGLREAHFDAGAFHLALGNLGEAKVAYAEAVGRYGPDPRARHLLEQFAREGVAPEGAQRILADHFGGATAR